MQKEYCGVRVRTFILSLAAIPYMSLVFVDFQLHTRARAVPLSEKFFHAIAASSLLAFGAAVASPISVAVIPAFLTYITVSILDEILFHRGIPTVERTVHYASWIALLGFLGVWQLLEPRPML